jgi:hypothetical protein
MAVVEASPGGSTLHNKVAETKLCRKGTQR